MDDDVVRGRRRGPGWVRVGHGLYHRATVADPFRARAQAWHLVLPEDAALSGPTAARLRGWDLPPLLPDLPVFAAMPEGRTAPGSPALSVSRHRDPPPYDVVQGLRVTRPAETLLTCASVLDLLDLVVVVDSALRAREVELLELWAAAGRRRRGAPRLRRALALADPLAESVMETLLRVLHQSCGVPVRAQHEIHDDTGGFVARADLWLVGTRTVQEYDGAHHRDPVQHRDDLRRDRRLARAGWVRHGYTAGDLLHRAPAVLLDADTAIGRAHRPDRIRGWHRLLRGSTFTPAGRAELAARVSR